MTDTVEAIRREIEKATGVRTVERVPFPRPDGDFIAVFQLGGDGSWMHPRFGESPVVSIEAWAHEGDEAGGRELAHKAWAVIDELVQNEVLEGVGRIRRVRELNGISRAPDVLTNLPRYIFSRQLFVRYES